MDNNQELIEKAVKITMESSNTKRIEELDKKLEEYRKNNSEAHAKIYDEINDNKNAFARTETELKYIREKVDEGNSLAKETKDLLLKSQASNIETALNAKESKKMWDKVIGYVLTAVLGAILSFVIISK